MARRKNNDILRFYNSGEDDGYRKYNDDGACLCNRCNTIMQPMEDMDVNCSYYECPKCGFIEIDEFYDDRDPEDYKGIGWDLW